MNPEEVEWFMGSIRLAEAKINLKAAKISQGCNDCGPGLFKFCQKHKPEFEEYLAYAWKHGV